MTISEMVDLFQKHENEEYLHFSHVFGKLSQRPDLHAFILLDRLCPDEFDIVEAAEHDEIWLGVDLSILSSVIIEEQVIELLRCGVRYDTEQDALSMFA